MKLSKIFLFLTVILSASVMQGESKTVKFKIIETSDVHGNFYPYDFINRRENKGSLARVHSLVEQARKEVGNDKIILVENGDILQGQPTAYYYNFIDTVSPHVGAEMLDFMGYNMATLGNHDIETGHSVYDRWIKQLPFPVLGANIIDKSTREPYVDPYTVVDVDGVKVAFLGMITPGIPGWLPETLWKNLEFADMVETAQKWVPVIKEKENPHIIVGLFHAGRDSTKSVANVVENQSMMVARNVPGFDIVLMGHDHSVYLDFIENIEGKDVLLANPSNNANKVVVIDVELEIDENGEIGDLRLKGNVKTTADYEPSPEFMDKFAPQKKAVEDFVNREIGFLTDSMTTRDAYFGPSAFIDFIHQMQLDISGAQISMAAPLTFDATLASGPITVADMFNLYKYENMLYTMSLTGQEIKDYLEKSYDIWTNTMENENDHLLRFRDTKSSDMTHTGFAYPSYNFDSAAGIIYTIDVTKPAGEKVTVVSMADRSAFDPKATYTVAINSYRGNGGGNLLTEGSGIDKEDLASRIITSTDKDLRYYLMKYIEEQGKVTPKKLNQWKFVPEEIAGPAAERDKKLLFGH